MAFPRPSHPIDLPDGRLACGDHGLTVCPICCVDFTFMDELLSDKDERSDLVLSDEDDHDRIRDSPGMMYDSNIDRSPRVRTSQVEAFGKFTPPTGTSPSSLFPPDITTRSSPVVHRFIDRTDSTQLLIYTDGACLGNGGHNPKAGCAFIFGPKDTGTDSFASFRLENKGPTGQVHEQTSNRAELRAVIAALRVRAWDDEGFKSIVIATDSDYVVKGATNWIRSWLRRDWMTAMGKPVKNRDLWEALLGEGEKWRGKNVDVRFWLIPRELNAEADQKAKESATHKDQDQFMDIMGSPPSYLRPA